MKPYSLLLCLVLVTAGGVSCQSASKKEAEAEARENSRLGDPTPDAEIGGYYRLKKSMNGFFFNIPNFTEVVPNRFLMRGHIVQLLDPAAGGGWARVKNEDFEIGYVQYDNIRVVPWEKQPKPKRRNHDAELDLNMRLD